MSFNGIRENKILAKISGLQYCQIDLSPLQDQPLQVAAGDHYRVQRVFLFHRGSNIQKNHVLNLT